MKRFLAVCLLALAIPASAFAWSGVYPTGDTFGSSVRVDVSSSYPVDATLPQTWATYLGTLVHGPELGRLTLDLAPLSEVQAKCGSRSLACYDPGSETILASPDDVLDAPPAQEIIAHEYGHHVANNRIDAPWSAEDYGTKRWASYENICARSVSGELAPGNEGSSYMENPGEAFAESYRVLNLTKAGQTAISWDIVDQSLHPDATALSLLEQDVLDPWSGPTLTHVHGSFGNGTVRTIGVTTTLDGSFAARLHAPAGSKLRLSLWNGAHLVARAVKSVNFQICGQRSLILKVERLSGRGAFTVDVSKP
ncbi:MAG: hypothetical protein M3P41_08820 [Actinomycetota bacterium]|nr:hypothetical protein [Actinomycetota bacterium]